MVPHPLSRLRLLRGFCMQDFTLWFGADNYKITVVQGQSVAPRSALKQVHTILRVLMSGDTI